jgi:hypothetical protein
VPSCRAGDPALISVCDDGYDEGFIPKRSAEGVDEARIEALVLAAEGVIAEGALTAERDEAALAPYADIGFVTPYLTRDN